MGRGGKMDQGWYGQSARTDCGGSGQCRLSSPLPRRSRLDRPIRAVRYRADARPERRVQTRVCYRPPVRSVPVHTTWLPSQPASTLSQACVRGWLRGAARARDADGLGPRVTGVAVAGTLLSLVWAAPTRVATGL